MPNIASIDRVGARVVWILGARGDDFAFEVEDDRFNKYEIANAIIETESELFSDFADAYHPERADFLAWLPADGLDSGNTVPGHLGQIEGVRIFPTSDTETFNPDEDEWVTGQSTTDTNIRLWRENYRPIDGEEGIFDLNDHDQSDSMLAGYFNLTNQTIEFTGGKAQVRIVVYNPTYPDASAFTYGTLQIASRWERALIAGTISKLGKIGVDPNILSSNLLAFNGARMAIRQGLSASPEINQA